MKMVKGSDLTRADQSDVLRSYVHRFTGEHIPQWAQVKMPDGSSYRRQFANDVEWLANTRFAVKANGTADKRAQYCESTPTWN